MEATVRTPSFNPNRDLKTFIFRTAGVGHSVVSPPLMREDYDLENLQKKDGGLQTTFCVQNCLANAEVSSVAVMEPQNVV